MGVPDEKVDCIVIGAGVVGLAIARRLALEGREVLVVEAEDSPGLGTSSRNSEVIHAGIYYPKGSLKAQLCVEGKNALYRYCEARGIPHQRIGKLIVATSDAELPILEGIRTKAADNGVADLEMLSRADVERLEPELEVAGALLSPSTGIVNSRALMLGLQGDAENAGATYAAGLSAHLVARSLAGGHGGKIPDVTYVKGNYFALGRRPSFNHLVYPVPEPGGLGVHLTLDMAGSVRFGPDVEPVDEVGYAVDPTRATPFYAAIRRYWPGLRDGELEPSYCGLRPKTNGLQFGDFDILADPSGRLISLFGIESPGLTSALALSDRVVQLVRTTNSSCFSL
ncbi:MAG: NAD(P)/FAD-dependent oxidoreductase [Mesorhizobium sp.]|nr:MAG: NAD(P)/FAD-dependent oxidoreductase [Mesorhizobium sp.]